MHRRTSHRRTITGVVSLLTWPALLTWPSSAEQHRVEPGQRWSHLGAVAKPGDEILLLPGRHLSASFSGLRGTAEQPITIRGLDAEHPAEIEAGASGLLLQSPSHVVLQDLIVCDARHNGINIDDQDGSGLIGGARDTHVTIRRVTVRRTGPLGNCDAVKLSGLRHVTIEHCLLEGWGGSGIDMVGCHDVAIESCTFRGLEGHTQATGIQAKGGSTRITISRCRFEDAALRAINIGGSTGLQYFRPPVPADAPPRTWYEAQDVRVEDCLFIEGDCAVAIVGARGAEIVRCTIVGPRRWPFRLLQETTDARFAPSQGGVVAACIIAADSLRTPINIGPNTSPDSFRFGANLWWAPGLTPEVLNLPGVNESQIVTDPQLDESQLPSAREAQDFGWSG